MSVKTLCNVLQQAVPPLFVCSPAPQEGVRVRTPMLYPDGGVVGRVRSGAERRLHRHRFRRRLGLARAAVGQPAAFPQAGRADSGTYARPCALSDSTTSCCCATLPATRWGSRCCASPRRRCASRMSGSRCAARRFRRRPTRWTNGCANGRLPSSGACRGRGRVKPKLDDRFRDAHRYTDLFGLPSGHRRPQRRPKADRARCGWVRRPEPRTGTECNLCLPVRRYGRRLADR